MTNQDDTTWRTADGRLAFSMSGPATDEEFARVQRAGEAAGLKGYFDGLCGWWRGEDNRPVDVPIMKFARAVANDVLATAASAPACSVSIDMILHCPVCGRQHIDAPEEDRMVDRLDESKGLRTWDNPPHRSHLCHGCGLIWRPADVPTNGVAAIKTKGSADSAPTAGQAGERDALRVALGMSTESLRIVMTERDDLRRELDALQAERGQLRTRLECMRSDLARAMSADMAYRVACDSLVQVDQWMSSVKAKEAAALRAELDAIRAQQPVGHVTRWAHGNGAYAWKIDGLESLSGLPPGEYALYVGPVAAAMQDAAASTRAEER